MKPIPIVAARDVAERFGYDQVVIVARKVGNDPEPHGEHVTTYGRTSTHCEIAARTGEFFKHHLMKWPGGRDMADAPRDGTHILAYLYSAPDDCGYKGFGEWREIWWKLYTSLGMVLTWHAGDPADSHTSGEAPEHFGEGVPIAWLPLPQTPTNRVTASNINGD